MPQTIQQPAAGNVTGKTTPILRASGLARSFEMGDSTLTILRGADFVVRDGEFVAIEGRSGSGKSTLLHILGALDGVSGGSVSFGGKDYTLLVPPSRSRLRGILQSGWFFGMWSIPWGLLVLVLILYLIFNFAAILTAGRIIGGAAALTSTAAIGVWLAHWGQRFVAWLVAYPAEKFAAELRNKEFGFVFQFYHLLPELNVLENTLLAPMIEHSWWNYRLARKKLTDRAKEVLQQMGLSHRLDHRPSQLSGGERQRVAIARALMNSPRVLFADEPTGNLDFETGRQIMSVLEALHRDKGQTIIMVTHDRALARTADRVLVLKDGRLHKAEDAGEKQ